MKKPRIDDDATRKMVDKALEAGWTWERGKGSHYKLRSPEGKLVPIGKNAGCVRSALNTRSYLRKAGLDV